MCCGEDGCPKPETSTAGNGGDNTNNVQTLIGGGGGGYYGNYYCPKCPHCTKCPTCGKDGYTPRAPYVIPNYYPWWQSPYIVTCNDGLGYVTATINYSNGPVSS